VVVVVVVGGCLHHQLRLDDDLVGVGLVRVGFFADRGERGFSAVVGAFGRR